MSNMIVKVHAFVIVKALVKGLMNDMIVKVHAFVIVIGL